MDPSLIGYAPTAPQVQGLMPPNMQTQPFNPLMSTGYTPGQYTQAAQSLASGLMAPMNQNTQQAYQLAGSPSLKPFASIAPPPLQPGSTGGSITSSNSPAGGILGTLGGLLSNAGTAKQLGGLISSAFGPSLSDYASGSVGNAALQSSLGGVPSLSNSDLGLTPGGGVPGGDSGGAAAGGQAADAAAAVGTGGLLGSAAGAGAGTGAVSITDAGGNLLAGTGAADGIGTAAGADAGSAASSGASSAASGVGAGGTVGLVGAGIGAAALAGFAYAANNLLQPTPLGNKILDAWEPTVGGVHQIYVDASTGKPASYDQQLAAQSYNARGKGSADALKGLVSAFQTGNGQIIPQQQFFQAVDQTWNANIDPTALNTALNAALANQTTDWSGYQYNIDHGMARAPSAPPPLKL